MRGDLPSEAGVEVRFALLTESHMEMGKRRNTWLG